MRAANAPPIVPSAFRCLKLRYLYGQAVLRGYNCALLCYGQTGSGKTHTMVGPDGGGVAALSPESFGAGLHGLNPDLDRNPDPPHPRHPQPALPRAERGCTA